MGQLIYMYKDVYVLHIVKQIQWDLINWNLKGTSQKVPIIENSSY